MKARSLVPSGTVPRRHMAAGEFPWFAVRVMVMKIRRRISSKEIWPVYIGHALSRLQ